MIFRYAIAVVKEEEEFWAFVPDVPGVYGRGDSREEALTDVTEALADYLAFLREQGEPLPEPATDSLEVRFAEVAA